MADQRLGQAHGQIDQLLLDLFIQLRQGTAQEAELRLSEFEYAGIVSTCLSGKLGAGTGAESRLL